MSKMRSRTTKQTVTLTDEQKAEVAEARGGLPVPTKLTDEQLHPLMEKSEDEDSFILLVRKADDDFDTAMAELEDEEIDVDASKIDETAFNIGQTLSHDAEFVATLTEYVAVKKKARFLPNLVGFMLGKLIDRQTLSQLPQPGLKWNDDTVVEAAKKGIEIVYDIRPKKEGGGSVYADLWRGIPQLSETNLSRLAEIKLAKAGDSKAPKELRDMDADDLDDLEKDVKADARNAIGCVKNAMKAIRQMWKAEERLTCRVEWRTDDKDKLVTGYDCIMVHNNAPTVAKFKRKYMSINTLSLVDIDAVASTPKHLHYANFTVDRETEPEGDSENVSIRTVGNFESASSDMVANFKLAKWRGDLRATLNRKESDAFLFNIFALHNELDRLVNEPEYAARYEAYVKQPEGKEASAGREKLKQAFSKGVAG